MKFLFRTFFNLVFLLISFLLLVIILKPVFTSHNIIFPYSIQKFNIYEKNPTTWYYLKLFYIIFYLFSNIIISNLLFNLLFNGTSFKKENLCQHSPNNSLNLYIGNNGPEKIYINETGLFQNFLITGTTGSGKTSSAIYPFTEQLIQFNNPPIAMLILDVKGNFNKYIKTISKKYHREDDLIIIEINGKFKYNPLHKPDVSAQVLANRLKTVLTLFSENNSDSYWLDKVEQVICESIKLCRLYNNNYVTFLELHKLITDNAYYNFKASVLKKMFLNNSLSEKEIYDFSTANSFFENEFKTLDSKVLSILKSEITRITNVFINDLDILNTFCPKTPEELTFKGFKNAIKNNKIVVLNINIAENKNLAKIVAAYLKLDFQSEILNNINKNAINPTAFICDEYQEYVTITDANFFALSREAKCINIIATQSYSSILNTLKNEYSTKVIIQNLINKLWFRTDDLLTIESAQKQIGKEDKIKISKNISENSKDINYNFLINSLNSNNSSFSEGINSYTQNEYIFDTNYFTKGLKTFEAIAFLSNGYEIIYSSKLSLIPFFK